MVSTLQTSLNSEINLCSKGVGGWGFLSVRKDILNMFPNNIWELYFSLFWYTMLYYRFFVYVYFLIYFVYCTILLFLWQCCLIKTIRFKKKICTYCHMYANGGHRTEIARQDEQTYPSKCTEGVDNGKDTYYYKLKVYQSSYYSVIVN